MKKLILAACAALLSFSAVATTLNPVSLLNPAGSTSGQAIISSGPTTPPAWGNFSISVLTGILPVSKGGTNAGSASGTALDNISGFAGTGFLTRTGAGAYAFQSTTNGITLGNLAQTPANTVLVNATNGTANVTAYTMSNCTGVIAALNWTAGTGFTCNTSVNASTLGSATFAAPGAIGSTTASTGAFTTLSASSTVSGTGFSNYLLTPPAIGSTTPNQGRFTSVFATTGYSLTNLVSSISAPTIASGFGTAAAVQNVNGTAAFLIHIGTGSTATSGTLTMPAATGGWMCDASDISGTNSASFYTKLTTQGPTTVTLTNYNTSGVAAPWAAGDFLAVKCSAF